MQFEIGRLSLNGPSDQLSPRTPPATFNFDVRTNASFARLPRTTPRAPSNLSRHNSLPAARTVPRKQSIFYPFLFSIF
jgi:hypothetical protein